MTLAPHPWGPGDKNWYAALESGGRTHGLARMVDDGRGVRFEVLDRATGGWRFDPEGPAKFTELGGITDAVPIDPGTALAIRRALLAGESVRASSARRGRRG